MSGNFNINAHFKIKDSASHVFGKLSKQAHSLGRQFKSVTAAGSHLVGSMGKILAPLTVMTGVAGNTFVQGIKGAREYANSIADLTERLGVSAEFLQKQHYIAKLNASSAEDMNTALGKLLKQYGALKSGTGALYAGLQKISPALSNQLKGAKSTEEAFNLMLKAIRKVEDPAKKVYLAQLAFGEAGKSMINIANQSEESLAALAKEAQDAGLVMDDAAIKGAADLGQELDNMHEHIRGVFNQLASKLIPILIPFIKRITEWIKANRELIGTKVDAFIKQFAEVLKKIDLEAILNGLSMFGSACLKVTDFIASMNKWLLLFAVLLGSGVVCNVLSLVTSLGKLLMMLPGIQTAFTVLIAVVKALSLGVLKLGIAFMATPIGWICAGVAAVVARFILLWNKCEGFRNFWIKLWEVIKTSFKAAVDFIGNLIDAIMHPFDTMMKNFERLKKVGGWIADKLGFGGDDEEEAKAQNGATKELAPTTLQQTSAAGRQQNSYSEVVVKFDNMPKEASVEKVSQEGKTDLGVEYGYALGGA